MTILVSNIHPRAEEADVLKLFGFCGPILRVSIQKSWAEEIDFRDDDPNFSKTAIIQFQEASSEQTSFLLTHALLLGRPIEVSPAPVNQVVEETKQPETVPQEVNGEDVQQPAPTQNKTVTSSIASILAAGYTLSSDAFSKAKEFDEKRQVSSTIKSKAQDVDNKLGISEKAAVVSQKVSDTSKKLNEEYHISEKVGNVKEQVSNTTQKVLQNESVAKGVSYLKSVKDAAVAKAQNISQETQAKIQENKKEKEQQS